MRPMPFLLAILLSVTLSAPFGEASAELIGFTPTEVTFEVTVEVLDPATIVLMRGVDVANNELDPVALLLREDGTWGAVVTLPARPDLRLLFEVILQPGGSVLSEASSLADLGIDRDLLTLIDPPEPVERTSSRPGLAWVILAGVAAAAALVLLLVWTRWGARSGDGIEGAVDADIPGSEA